MVWAGGPSLQREENSKKLSERGSGLSPTVTVGDGQKGNGFEWDRLPNESSVFGQNHLCVMIRLIGIPLSE
jgi:hypothetical protein